MFPAEFVDRFGIPVPRTVTIGPTVKQVAERNPDRYFLGFVCASANALFQYEINDLLTNPEFLLDSTHKLFLPHALYGSLVNARWFARVTVGPVNLLVIEGFMPREKP